jgi:hypothetical protein
MEKIQKLQNDINDWSTKTFKEQKTPIPILKHLVKEIEKELIPALEEYYDYKKYGTDLTLLAGSLDHVIHEFADVQILALDSMAHLPLPIEDLIPVMEAKMEINKKRKWKAPDKDGICEHVEEAEAPKGMPSWITQRMKNNIISLIKDTNFDIKTKIGICAFRLLVFSEMSNANITATEAKQIIEEHFIK